MSTERKYKVIVAHPSKQHSFYTATAFERKGYLEAYITTIYDKEGSITNKLKKVLWGKNLSKISTRSSVEIPSDRVIQFYELDYLISIFLNKFPRLRKLREKHRMYVANKFGKKVVNYIEKHPVDAIIMYDSTAFMCFKMLRQRFPNIVRILDVSIATRPYMKENFERDMKLTGTKELYKEHPEFWNEKKMKPFVEEINLADYFFVPSNVVKNSLVFCGQDESKISIVPYGVNVEQFSYNENNHKDGPLKIIYVGQVTHRKGIHHLLNVIKRFDEKQVEVELIGTFDAKSNIYKNSINSSNINFCGFVTREKLAEKYRNADVFIFPTLGEGFGLVVLEALGCGVPVLCSTLAGGDDAIDEGVNGYKFNPFDEEELYSWIQKFLSERIKLSDMRKAANETAQKYTWEIYYNAIIKAFNNCMEGRSENEDSSSCTNET